MSDDIEMPGLHPGYSGMFTRHQMPGAVLNGSRVVKVRGEPGDIHPIGALGVVLGSMGRRDAGFGYFVEWDSRPRRAFFISDSRIDAAPEDAPPPPAVEDDEPETAEEEHQRRHMGVVVLQVDLSGLTINPQNAMQTSQGVEHLRADIARLLTDERNIIAVRAIMPVIQAKVMLSALKTAMEMMGEDTLKAPDDYVSPHPEA